MDGDFSYANFEFVRWIFSDRLRDLVRTPLPEPYGHETPHAEPFSYLYSVHYAEKSSLESLDSSLGLDS